MPAPVGHFRKEPDGSKPPVVVPFRSGHQSDDGKRSTNALDLLKDVRSTVLLHGGLLHELRDLYKHLRVELKDDIYELVEQMKGTEHQVKPMRPSQRSTRSKASPSPELSVSQTQFSIPNVPDELTRVTLVEDLDEAPMEVDEEGRSTMTSTLAKRFAWKDSEAHEAPEAPSDVSPRMKTGHLGRSTSTRSFKQVIDLDGERMPPVPLEKSRYYSSVDLFQALQVDEDAGWIERMVRKDSFDYVMGSLLALNAVIIGIQVDLVSKDPSDPAWSRAIDLLFCSVFVVELLLRIYAYGRRFFSMDGWQWNLFDSLVVFFSLADEATKLVLSDSEVQEIFDSFGMLRLLRLGRIVRLVRMVRLIPALKSMVYLILASLKSFLWTVVLLIILMYCVAVYFTELAYDLKHKHPQKDFALVRQTWGSIGNSILSLFQAITGGNDWHVFISVFDDFVGSTSTNTFVFSIFIAFATLVMMNLVTGVFVDGAQRIAREEKNQELLKHVRRLLAPEKSRPGPRPSVFVHGEVSLDNGDQLITWVDFCKKLNTEEMRAYLTAFELDASQAKDIFYILDQDRVGKVTMREFFSACVNLHGRPRLADTAILRHLIQRTFADLADQIHHMDMRIAGYKPARGFNARSPRCNFSPRNTFTQDD